MKQVIESLLQLQAAEMGARPGAMGSTQAEELRKNIPGHVLLHFDRLRARGKKGIAYVRHGVCGQCHMQVALGLLAQLRREDNLYRCENCGAYLSLADEIPTAAPVLEMPPRATKPGRRGRPRKLATHVA